MKEKSYKLLLSLGYTDSDANEILSSDWLHNFKDEDLEKNISNIYNYLEKYYTKNEIIKITRKSSILFKCNNTKDIEDKLDDIVGFGYSKEEVIKMFKKVPSLYSLKVKTIRKKINDMIELGYTKEEVLKMTKKSPSLYCYNNKNIKKKIDDMIELGYTKEDAIKMSKKCSSLYTFNIESMKIKIEDMISLGYTKEDVIEMTKNQPNLYSLSIEYIKQRIKDIISLGYERKDAIEITKKLPSLFGLSMENIKEKINFYKRINLENIVLEDTKQLMQSATLSYARYRYLTIKGIKITKDNYGRLFYSQQNFKEIYNIDNETLKGLYPFEEYIKVQQFYKKLYILSKLNPNGAKEFLNKNVKKYVDANNSVEKRINNKYDRILKK